jgi:hypothetical protein
MSGYAFLTIDRFIGVRMVEDEFKQLLDRWSDPSVDQKRERERHGNANAV